MGACCQVDQIGQVLDAGFDYAEIPANTLLKSEVRTSGVESANLFFPSGARLFGPEPFDWRTYAGQTLSKAAEWGIRTVVIGSGRNRASAPGITPVEAEDAFCDMAMEIQALADRYGIQAAPESLNRSETDVGNDPAILAEKLRVRGVPFTFDTYHAIAEWYAQGEPCTLSKATLKSQLTLCPIHVHLATKDRLVPEGGEEDLALIFQHLADLGFDGHISLECRDTFDQDLAEAAERSRKAVLEYLR